MDAAIEQLTEAFQCPVCYELISSRHKSRALPCGHGNVCVMLFPQFFCNILRRCDADLTTLWQQVSSLAFKTKLYTCNVYQAQQSGTPFKCPSQGCSLPRCEPKIKTGKQFNLTPPSCPPIDRLPHNWALISAGDAFEDLLAARDSGIH
jgi:hypothetical protein